MGFKCIFLAPNFALDSVVVKTQNCLAHMKAINTCNVSPQRNNLIKLIHFDEAKKMAHDSVIVRAKENLKLNYSGPGQRQSSGTNQRIKALRQGRH